MELKKDGVDVIVHPDKQQLCEIPQDNKTEFALCRYDDESNQLIQCHQFVHCRDFMGDAQVGAETNQDMAIYSFRYLKSYPRIDQENTSLLMRLPDSGSLKAFQENLSVLRSIEEVVNWEKTHASLVDYPGNDKIVWVLGDGAWQKSGLGFSLYTYILKCMTYRYKDKTKWMEEVKTMKTVEARYMDPDYLTFIFNNLDDIVGKYKNFSGYNVPKDIGTIHNFTGFHSMKACLKTTGAFQSKMYSDHVLNGYKAPK